MMTAPTHGHQRSTDWDAFSANYHAESVTPFARGVRFRLRSDLKTLIAEWRNSERRRRVFVDFGCGPGDALECVAGSVPLSVGIDFAPKMLALAAERLTRRRVWVRRCSARVGYERVCKASDATLGSPSNEKETLLVRGELRDLSSIRGCVDAATSINSICASNTRDATRMFREMARSIRPGGLFYCVWPAVESLSYLHDLERRAGDPPEARNERLLRNGVHVDATGYTLKLFSRQEIERLCEQSRLRVEVLEELRYPWSYMSRLGWGAFAGKPPLWDWYTIARAI